MIHNHTSFSPCFSANILSLLCCSTFSNYNELPWCSINPNALGSRWFAIFEMLRCRRRCVCPRRIRVSWCFCLQLLLLHLCARERERKRVSRIESTTLLVEQRRVDRSKLTWKLTSSYSCMTSVLSSIRVGGLRSAMVNEWMNESAGVVMEGDDGWATMTMSAIAVAHCMGFYRTCTVKCDNWLPLSLSTNGWANGHIIPKHHASILLIHTIPPS